MSDAIVVVRDGERTVPAAGQTPGIVREEAFSSDGRWAGLARLDPATPSGWHHHGDNDTYIYVLSGAVRFEHGPGGRTVAEAGPGDFIHVPPRVVHREENPGPEPGEVVVVRAGSGPPLVNVEGPDA